MFNLTKRMERMDEKNILIIIVSAPAHVAQDVLCSVSFFLLLDAPCCHKPLSFVWLMYAFEHTCDCIVIGRIRQSFAAYERVCAAKLFECKVNIAGIFFPVLSLYRSCSMAFE